MYDIIGRQGTYQNYYWSFLSSVSDVEYYRVSSPGATNPLLFNQLPSDPYITSCWNTLYDGINRANALLGAIDNSPVDTTIKKPIKAQAQFLRGYYYFLLVSNWGEVPLRLRASKVQQMPTGPNHPLKTSTHKY
ncbi:RagB/SusD family nutrient uptake outer membrane protein [Paraflavitalea speifideaquila]|uniref:RagB/SusD family nutrient uptake outer membrane protein n=1 Tax=Paraflavitalea speifideaquila TaxID=3076558 RepID=UPI0028E857FC|nr:RagB/SusD family nutrient uptake outer membrane protein [Paraflavitalea speifideiaquila]